MAKSSVHLNGNVCCAVDVETTGLIAGYHEIWQICVLPLDSLYKPSKEIMPFYQELKISKPDLIEKNAIRGVDRNAFAIKQKRALDPFDAADLFEEWFLRLKLPIYKKIVPLAQNWPFDRAFLLEWLGFSSFNDFFHPHYRDAMAAAIFLMDIASFRGERVLLSKFNLAELCGKTNVTNDKAHDAMQDCRATAEVYKRLIQNWAP